MTKKLIFQWLTDTIKFRYSKMMPGGLKCWQCKLTASGQAIKLTIVFNLLFIFPLPPRPFRKALCSTAYCLGVPQMVQYLVIIKNAFLENMCFQEGKILLCENIGPISCCYKLWVCRLVYMVYGYAQPQRVWFLSLFGLKMGIKILKKWVCIQKTRSENGC